MSKLDDLLLDTLREMSYEIEQYGHIDSQNYVIPKRKQVIALVESIIPDIEQRQTEDMSLKSWTPEDYKAFGRNELIVELKQKIAEL